MYFPDTYITSIILKSRLLVRLDKNYSKGYELALEAETLSLVEENNSLLIDSQLAIIECLLNQNKLNDLENRLNKVKLQIENLNETEVNKRSKLLLFTQIRNLYNDLDKKE